MAGLIDFLTDVLIIFLFFRFVALRKRYQVRGMLMSGILRLTDSLVKPFQPLVGNFSALVAIACLVVLRGVLFGMFTGALNAFGIVTSLVYFVDFSAQTIFLFLCFSYLLSRQGYHATFNVFIEFIHDVAFDCFRLVKKVLRSDSLNVLFPVSVLLLILAHSVTRLYVVNFALGLISARVSVSTMQVAIGTSMLVLLSSLTFFVYLLVLHIVISWIRGDPYFEPVQVVKALSAPFIEMTRKVFPWTRVGMFDLSVLIVILFLRFLQTALGQMIAVWFKVQ